MIKQYRIGVKSRNQLPWFMIWVEYRPNMDTTDVDYASVIYSTHHGWPRWLCRMFGAA